MDRVLDREEVARLIPEPNLAARVVYFPVRHHSPACAWHVGRLIRELKPNAVLIEGPRDATPLLFFLNHPRTRMPVAFYTTFVQRREDDLPLRHASYYPLCDYSPELAAVRAAAEVGAEARFIDLTYPEMVLAGQAPQDQHAHSLLEERYLSHSRLLRAACRRTGARDPDDLWDHLYEVGYEHHATADFMRHVLAYCALARHDYTPEMLAADGCAAREAAMAAAVADTKGKVVVVTGGFHTCALPTTKPAMPPAAKVAPEDAQVVLMRYGFEQLDRLNGYASGMPSPEFYQRCWEGRDPAEILTELGRECRERQPGTASPADVIAALAHTHRLAQFRGHPRPSREDLLDGVRSVLVKGADDVEGVLTMALARKLLAGERVGDVPPEAGQPPLVEDFRRTAASLKIDLDRVEERETSLDIYRKVRAREASRLFHRLGFLEVPFATKTSGPDFVGGKNLERVQEVWRYRWTPHTESRLIEQSLYGATLEEAATALLLERLAAAQKQGQGRRSDVAASLLLEACRMGLHRHTADLLARTRGLVAEDAQFVSLVRTIQMLLVLNVSREPLEAHDLEGLGDLAGAAYDRACYLLPGLVNTGEAEEKETLEALNGLCQAAQTLGDFPERRQLRWDRLQELARTAGGSAVVRGAAVGLLFGDGQVDAQGLVAHLRGHLHSARDRGAEGPRFLRGLLRTARSALWQVPDVLRALHEVLAGWEEEHFVRQLPNLRLAFADLTPRECDQVARSVAEQAGVAKLEPVEGAEFTSADMLRGAEVNRRVLEGLRRDGLEVFAASHEGPHP